MFDIKQLTDSQVDELAARLDARAKTRATEAALKAEANDPLEAFRSQQTAEAMNAIMAAQQEALQRAYVPMNQSNPYHNSSNEASDSHGTFDAYCQSPDLQKYQEENAARWEQFTREQRRR